MTTINELVGWLGDQDISPGSITSLVYSTGARGFSQLGANAAIWAKDAVVGTTKTVCDVACRVTFFEGDNPSGGHCTSQVLPYLVAPAVCGYLTLKYGYKAYHSLQALSKGQRVVTGETLPLPATSPGPALSPGTLPPPGFGLPRGEATTYSMQDRPTLVKDAWVQTLIAVASFAGTVFFLQGGLANIQELK